MSIIDIKEHKKKTIGERHIYTQELLKRLKKVSVGEIINYNELSKIIGINVRPGFDGYSYQKSARDISERDEKIVFEVVPTVGLKRISKDDVAESSLSMYQEKKKSNIKRVKRRIETVDDDYDKLNENAKQKTLALKTLLVFDNEISKGKNILKITDQIKTDQKLIGFESTLDLFKS